MEADPGIDEPRDFLPGEALVGHVQHAAEPRGRIEQHSAEAALLQDHGGCDPRGAAITMEIPDQIGHSFRFKSDR